jgi:DNA-binding response OmpR family regulator
MAGERPILIVDDDASLLEELAAQLQVDGEFSADEAASVSQAEAMLKQKEQRYDALILDVSLPDGDGRDFCANLRKQGLRMPIIMLTGSDEEADVVRGLESGANDYIAKPFRLNELLARLRAQLRIFENSEDAVFTIGLQRSRHHPHARDTYLPPAPEDRTRSRQCPAAGDRRRWLPAGP